MVQNFNCTMYRSIDRNIYKTSSRLPFIFVSGIEARRMAFE
jgi:hypothetical protein